MNNDCRNSISTKDDADFGAFASIMFFAVVVILSAFLP